MELIVINSRKLKIMMTSEDMAEYELKCENIDYDNAKTRRAFRCIFERVKQKTGFDASSERVFVQLFPSKGGGCEMYITKLTGGVVQEKGVSSEGKRMEIYRFERFEWLAAACARLRSIGYTGESSAYYDLIKNRYFLMMSECALSALGAPSVSEFGLSVDTASASLYIKEYCRCICGEDAVSVLCKM